MDYSSNDLKLFFNDTFLKNYGQIFLFNFNQHKTNLIVFKFKVVDNINNNFPSDFLPLP